MACRDRRLRKHFQRIKDARGKYRLASHPMLFEPNSSPDSGERFIKRLVLSDVWHNGVSTNSHKQLNCKLRLTQLIRELQLDSTSFSAHTAACSRPASSLLNKRAFLSRVAYHVPHHCRLILPCTLTRSGIEQRPFRGIPQKHLHREPSVRHPAVPQDYVLAQ